jgi:hypothetical protein
VKLEDAETRVLRRENATLDDFLAEFVGDEDGNFMQNI